MLIRHDPFRELDRFFAPTPARTPSAPIDAYRRGDHVFVDVDLPGVQPESIDVTVERNVLTVRAERRWAPAEGDELVVRERPSGVYSRQLFLGETLDAGRLEASYENGVLTLTIPVAEAAKPRKVEVRVGESTAHAIDAGSTEQHAAA